MKNKHYLVIFIGVLLIGAVIWFMWPAKKTVAPTVNTTATVLSNQNVNTVVEKPVVIPAGSIALSTSDLPDRDPAFDFTAAIPKNWRVEYVSSSTAINIYDPKALGSTSLEKSQIFIKYFTASNFQTLSTVDIKSQTTTTINDRPAVIYVIEKKSGIKDFVGQPSWRNKEHRVTDIRSTDESPTTFYVFAKSPDINDEVFVSFLNTVKFIES